MEKEVERQLKVIKKGTEEIIPEEELVKKIRLSLKKNNPLRIKYGIAPPGSEIHIGHTVPIRKLRDFQNLGHKIIFLIGDFTAMIGDPSGRIETRLPFTKREIEKNLSNYKKEVGKILDLRKTEFVYNSQWLSKLKLEEILNLMSSFTLAQLLEREDFTRRYRENRPISLQEFIYPLMQAYDSVVLKADVEIGATEQKFNLLAGRTLQQYFKQTPQVVITTQILVGTDGVRKMSKTYNNYISISLPFKEMFGKLMSIKDGLIESYLTLLTGMKKEEIIKIKKSLELHAREAKENMAKEITSFYYGKERAEKTAREFAKVFRDKEMPSDIPILRIEKRRLKDGKIWILNLLSLSGISSRKEAKRLIEQRGVTINGKLIDNFQESLSLKGGEILKIGKLRFYKLKILE